MFINDTHAQTVSATADAGAVLDVKSINQTEALMIASGVIGAGVVGTSLIIATYAAPAPIIGGTALALGCIGTATMIGNEDDLDGSSVEPAPVKSESKTPSEPVSSTKTAPVVDRNGVEVEIEDL